MKRLSSMLFGLFVSLAPVSAAHASSLPSVAKRLSKGLKPLAVKRVAVLPFPYHNGDLSSGSSIVSERLTTLIVEGGAEVVERALLDKAIGEIKLGMSGLLDPSSTQKLGKTLGVSAVVTGTLIDLEERQTEVNARLIQTETGAILAAATTRIRRSWEDLPRPPQAVSASSPAEEPATPLHMSKLIPASSPRRNRYIPPVYSGPLQPLPGDSNEEPAENVLTLRNDDLIPVNHRGQTDPERIIRRLLSETDPPPPYALRVARRIYHRHPDPKVRGRALLAMGRLLERSGRPGLAARAYSQILREFPEAPALQNEARQRLDTIAR